MALNFYVAASFSKAMISFAFEKEPARFET